MKSIFLIRHAEPVVDDSLNDKDRPLTDYGIRQALNIADKLNKDKLFPDYVLCSSAIRTKQTAENIVNNLSVKMVLEYTDNLYYATPGNIHETIKNLSNEYMKVMIISHNPAISNLANLLADEISLNKFLSEKPGFAPADTILFQFQIGSWQELELSQGNIKWICRS